MRDNSSSQALVGPHHSHRNTNLEYRLCFLTMSPLAITPANGRQILTVSFSLKPICLHFGTVVISVVASLSRYTGTAELQ